jgi:hypothetical protein
MGHLPLARSVDTRSYSASQQWLAGHGEESYKHVPGGANSGHHGGAKSLHHPHTSDNAASTAFLRLLFACER